VYFRKAKERFRKKMYSISNLGQNKKDMSTFRRFEEMICWQEARSLNLILGKMIDEKKFANNFRLINQMEGSAGSIMDNIAEGYERSGNKEFIQYLYIAKASCGELRSQLYRAFDRQYINENEFELLSNHVKKISSLIHKFISYLVSASIKGIKFKSRAS
jgi:four helix bundle protein